MDHLQAIFLGLLQGVCEFLPISSSGHLALFQFIFGHFHDLTFEVLVHLATLLSVFTVMHKPIHQVMQAFFLDVKNRRFGQGIDIIAKILVGCLPAGLVGMLFKESLASFFSSLYIIGSGFALTAVLLLSATLLTSSFPMRPASDQLLSAFHHISYTKALCIGCFQAIALIPGVSRSGATIAGGLFLGLDVLTATYFSFFLAIPTIIGAVILQISLETPALPLSVLLLGFLSAYVVGTLSLMLLLRIVQWGYLKYFAFYLLCLATIVFISGVA